MNNKTRFSLGMATAAILGVASIAPAFAAVVSNRLSLKASTNNISVQLDSTAKTKADAQIDARVKALTELQTRIGQMKRVSADGKASLNASIQSTMTEMATLKTKIDADTDNATLKTDMQSISKSYRVYLLVMPQGRIIAAADRVVTTAGLMTELSAKLQTRITTAQTSGQNIIALTASLADMNAKTADANIQAQAAISAVANLKADNGDKTVYESNQTALKDARAKIKTAMTDLKTARQDAGSIVKVLVSLKASASATTTAQ